MVETRSGRSSKAGRSSSNQFQNSTTSEQNPSSIAMDPTGQPITLETLYASLSQVLAKIQDLTTMVGKVAGLEKTVTTISQKLDNAIGSLEFTQNHVETLISNALPKAFDHIAKVQTASIIVEVEKEVCFITFYFLLE